MQTCYTLLAPVAVITIPMLLLVQDGLLRLFLFLPPPLLKPSARLVAAAHVAANHTTRESPSPRESWETWETSSPDSCTPLDGMGSSSLLQHLQK